MAPFDPKLFSLDGDYLTYDGQTFVARFKHQPRDRAHFQKFLVKNFQAEEYFDLREKGMTPVAILETKGYVAAHILKWLRDGKLKEWRGESAASILGRQP